MVFRVIGFGNTVPLGRMGIHITFHLHSATGDVRQPREMQAASYTVLAPTPG